MSEQLYHTSTLPCKPGRLLDGRARMVVAGGVVTVTASTNMGRAPAVVRYDAGHYIVVSTGELVGMAEKAVSRADNADSLRRSMATLRDIINANFGQHAATAAQSWLTLTYRECVRDTQRVADDFEEFIRWLRRRVGARVEYISVIEPQRRGAWHLHVLLLRPDGGSIFVPQPDMLAAWRRIAARRTPPELLRDSLGRNLSSGGLHVHSLADGGDNVGAYLSAYLTDDDGKKGARLSLYPAGVQYYRCSRGIRRPEVREYARLSDALRDAADITGSDATYDDTRAVMDADGRMVQVASRTQFKRRKST